jgi:predicted transcriptional regulator
VEPISNSEWILLSCVWDLGTPTAGEVAEHYARKYPRTDFPLSSSTIGILLARLVARGFLRSKPVPREGRGRPAHVYEPCYPYEKVLRHFVAQILENTKLDAETLARVASSLKRPAPNPVVPITRPARKNLRKKRA